MCECVSITSGWDTYESCHTYGWFDWHWWYGVATISRLLEIERLFCKRALQKRLHSATETYDCKEPTNRSHPISWHHSCDVRHIWVKSHMWMSHITRTNESALLSASLLSETHMSHVTYMNESRLSSERVTWHIWMRDTYECVTHMNASEPLQAVVLRECDRNKYK